ncbi:endocuticle structural glycoprotein SgAbd-3-like [Macrosteles quadrilineatus]|uniref:endocuticle structural glycoprotein SgAbd-3-like n=1 Tax=Macrosteles quadrilineatus TaxID=74068 RepID=UPI0023E28EC7|nr:endocuticle structural glycoprotein SgAbd-3-like [Macrosteles quadrilineatus]
MNNLVVLTALLACTAAAPQYNRPRASAPASPGAAPKEVLILKQAQEVNYDGSFNYDFETENGIASSAQGQLKNAGTDTEALVITGSYSYTGDDGVPVVITYIADENGFQPQGAILPTPPPVPEAIQRALDYLRSLPPSKDDQRK